MRAYLDGWKAIAEALGRSSRWCRLIANRPVDPLPVFKFGGGVRLNLADLDAWLDRQRAATVRTSSDRAPAAEEHW
jgi:hypothetical protein